MDYRILAITSNAQMLYEMAIARKDRNRLDRAKRKCEKGLQIDPSNPELKSLYNRIQEVESTLT